MTLAVLSLVNFTTSFEDKHTMAINKAGEYSTPCIWNSGERRERERDKERRDARRKGVVDANARGRAIPGMSSTTISLSP